MPPQEKQLLNNELCQAGKLLEARLIPCTKSLEKACQTLQKTCTQISESINDLTKYAIRDKEKIEVLEKSRDCKSKKLKVLEDETQDQAIKLATHLGEHEAERRLTVASGIGGAGGVLGVWELIKYLVKGS